MKKKKEEKELMINKIEGLEEFSINTDIMHSDSSSIVFPPSHKGASFLSNSGKHEIFLQKDMSIEAKPTSFAFGPFKFISGHLKTDLENLKKLMEKHNYRMKKGARYKPILVIPRDIFKTGTNNFNWAYSILIYAEKDRRKKK